MSEKQVIVTLEDGFGRVQTSIATSLSAPQLMEKIMGIDEQQATIHSLQKDIIEIIDSHQSYIEMESETKSKVNDIIRTQRIEIRKLSKENEQLRKTINEVIELLLEEVDLFSDKATEHDIIAYKEMNQFDNKDAYYMCISTKKAIKMLQRCLDE